MGSLMRRLRRAIRDEAEYDREERARRRAGSLVSRSAAKAVVERLRPTERSAAPARDRDRQRHG